MDGENGSPWTIPRHGRHIGHIIGIRASSDGPVMAQFEKFAVISVRVRDPLGLNRHPLRLPSPCGRRSKTGAREAVRFLSFRINSGFKVSHCLTARRADGNQL